MTPHPLKWHGGKSYLSEKIISKFPKHIHYVELYFGGGAVLLDKSPSGSEVINDINRWVTNFWATLQNPEAFEKLVRRLEATPFSQVEFEAVRDLNFRTSDWGIPDVERAAQFFIRCRQSRQGLMKDFATLSRNRTRRDMNEQVSSWLTAIDGLPEVHERLKRVVVYNSHALKVLRKEDGPNTLFYADPPYLHETRQTTEDYDFEMTPQEHRAMLMALSSIEGKFILSGYPSELYDEFARKYSWRREDIPIDNKSSSSKEKETKIECLWSNF